MKKPELAQELVEVLKEGFKEYNVLQQLILAVAFKEVYSVLLDMKIPKDVIPVFFDVAKQYALKNAELNPDKPEQEETKETEQTEIKEQTKQLTFNNLEELKKAADKKLKDMGFHAVAPMRKE